MTAGESRRSSEPAYFTTVPTAPVEAAHAGEQVPRYCTALKETPCGASLGDGVASGPLRRSWGNCPARQSGDRLPLVAPVPQWRQHYPKNRPPTRATVISAVGHGTKSLRDRVLRRAAQTCQ
jgi:hypothetical protein